MNRFWILFFTLALLLRPTPVDADRLLPITALAVTRTESGYALTLEGARQSALDGEAEAVQLTVRSSSPDALLREAQSQLAGGLSLTHAALLILDMALEASEVTAFCGTLQTHAIPRNLAVLRSPEPTALLTYDPPTETIPGPALRALLQSQTDLPTIRNWETAPCALCEKDGSIRWWPA